MLILLLGITRQAYSKNGVIITDRKCRDQVSDQELSAKQNATKHGIGPPSSDHLSCIRELILSFVSVMSVDDTVHSQKKSHDYACGVIKLSLSVRDSRLTQALARRIRHVMTHFH